MITRDTFAQMVSDTCPGCQRRLGVHHAYPVTEPETLLTLLTDHPPRCRACAIDIAENQPDPPDGRPNLAVVIVVKTSSAGISSGRLIKLHPYDPTTWRLHLHTPASIDFKHMTNNPAAQSQVIRPATNEEAEAYLSPTIAHLSATIAPGTNEHRSLLQQLALLQKHLPKPQTQSPHPTSTHP
jgi:hypothetical protein